MTNYIAGLAFAALLSGSAVAADAVTATVYTQASTGNSLTFGFVQAGADSKGTFKQFSTSLGYDEKNLAVSTLDVKVQVGSLDTQDKDRDDTLKTADLFNSAKFPTATYAASSLTKRPDGKLEAVGKLTLRGVTRELRLPLTLRPTAAGLELSGEATIKRLDFGVGQGEWQSTEWVGDDVRLQYKVSLVRAAGK